MSDTDAPFAPSSEITRYASYNYRNYADIEWFPPIGEDRPVTAEDRDNASKHAEEHNRLYGSDLMFGGFDLWQRNYGAAYEALQAEKRATENTNTSTED